MITDELRTTVAAAEELGDEYEHAVARSLVERLDGELAARERERRGTWLREGATVTIALGSVGLGVLVAATAGELATIVAWVVIAVVNVAHARRR